MYAYILHTLDSSKQEQVVALLVHAALLASREYLVEKPNTALPQ